MLSLGRRKEKLSPIFARIAGSSKKHRHSVYGNISPIESLNTRHGHIGNFVDELDCARSLDSDHIGIVRAIHYSNILRSMSLEPLEIFRPVRSIDHNPPGLRKPVDKQIIDDATLFVEQKRIPGHRRHQIGYLCGNHARNKGICTSSGNFELPHMIDIEKAD